MSDFSFFLFTFTIVVEQSLYFIVKKMEPIEKISVDDILNKNANARVVENIIFSESTEIPTDVLLDFPHIFEGVLLSICLDGTAEIKINLRKYTVSKNTLTIIFPNQIFEHIKRGQNLHTKTLFFPIDLLSDLPFPSNFDVAFKIGKQSCIKIPNGIMQELLTYFSLIENLHQRTDQAYRKEIAKGLLYTTIMQACSIYVDTECNTEIKSARKEELLHKFFRLMINHRKEIRNVAFYADKLFVTPKYLSSTLKKATGKTANEWINESVIIEAKSMLKRSNMTVLQISEELNFPNPSFFGRYFKQYAGMTPVEYRES